MKCTILRVFFEIKASCRILFGPIFASQHRKGHRGLEERRVCFMGMTASKYKVILLCICFEKGVLFPDSTAFLRFYYDHLPSSKRKCQVRHNNEYLELYHIFKNSGIRNKYSEFCVCSVGRIDKVIFHHFQIFFAASSPKGRREQTKWINKCMTFFFWGYFSGEVRIQYLRHVETEPQVTLQIFVLLAPLQQAVKSQSSVENVV